MKRHFKHTKKPVTPQTLEALVNDHSLRPEVSFRRHGKVLYRYFQCDGHEKRPLGELLCSPNQAPKAYLFN